MKNIKRTLSRDTYFWQVSRIACFALSVLAVCVLRLTVTMTYDHDVAMRLSSVVPEMIKNVLCGCASVFIVGFLFELETRDGEK